MASRQDNDKFDRFVASDFLPSYMLDSVIDWIKQNLEPNDVFDDAALEQWAEDNEFIPKAEAEAK